jgi:hypothetical protein
MDYSFISDPELRKLKLQSIEADRNYHASTEPIDLRNIRTVEEVIIQPTKETVYVGDSSDTSDLEAKLTQAEAKKNAAEAARVAAENDKIAAEAARVTAENDKIAAEAARVAEEAARLNAEREKAAEEVARVAAETQLAQAQIDNATLTSENAALTITNSNLSAEDVRLNSVIATLGTQISALTTQVGTIASLEAEKKAAVADVTRLQGLLALATAGSSSSALVTHLQDALRDAQLEISQFGVRLNNEIGKLVDAISAEHAGDIDFIVNGDKRAEMIDSIRRLSNELKDVLIHPSSTVPLANDIARRLRQQVSDLIDMHNKDKAILAAAAASALDVVKSAYETKEKALLGRMASYKDSIGFLEGEMKQLMNEPPPHTAERQAAIDKLAHLIDEEKRQLAAAANPVIPSSIPASLTGLLGSASTSFVMPRTMTEMWVRLAELIRKLETEAREKAKLLNEKATWQNVTDSIKKKLREAQARIKELETDWTKCPECVKLIDEYKAKLASLTGDPRVADLTRQLTEASVKIKTLEVEKQAWDLKRVEMEQRHDKDVELAKELKSENKQLEDDHKDIMNQLESLRKSSSSISMWENVREELRPVLVSQCKRLSKTLAVLIALNPNVTDAITNKIMASLVREFQINLNNLIYCIDEIYKFPLPIATEDIGPIRSIIVEYVHMMSLALRISCAHQSKEIKSSNNVGTKPDKDLLQAQEEYGFIAAVVMNAYKGKGTILPGFYLIDPGTAPLLMRYSVYYRDLHKDELDNVFDPAIVYPDAKEELSPADVQVLQNPNIFSHLIEGAAVNFGSLAVPVWTKLNNPDYIKTWSNTIHKPIHDAVILINEPVKLTDKSVKPTSSFAPKYHMLFQGSPLKPTIIGGAIGEGGYGILIAVIIVLILILFICIYYYSVESASSIELTESARPTHDSSIGDSDGM